MVSVLPVSLTEGQTAHVRRIAESIVSVEGQTTVLAHDSGPYRISAMVRDCATAVEVTKKDHPHMLAVTAFGWAGRAEGDLGLLDELLAHFGELALVS